MIRRSLLTVCLTSAAACASGDQRGAPDAHAEAIADSLKALVADAYRLDGDDAVGRIMSLYPERGSVVSAAAGRISTSRDSLERSIRLFWDRVGVNMGDPRFAWREVYVDVLSDDAAVLTGTYAIPHRTPEGRAHTIGGAWTAVFERRDGRWVIVHEHLSDAPDTLGVLPAPADHSAHEGDP